MIFPPVKKVSIIKVNISVFLETGITNANFHSITSSGEKQVLSLST